MKQTRTVAVFLAALGVGWPAGASAQKAGSSGRPKLVEPRAEEVLKAMSARLAVAGTAAAAGSPGNQWRSGREPPSSSAWHSRSASTS